MRWVRQPLLLLAIVIIAANAECVARCSTMPCHDRAAVSGTNHLPPCHKHRAPQQKDDVTACGSAVLLVADRSASASAPDSAPAAIVEIARPFEAWMPSAFLARDSASPPGVANSISVLRV